MPKDLDFILFISGWIIAELAAPAVFVTSVPGIFDPYTEGIIAYAIGALCALAGLLIWHNKKGLSHD